MADEGASVGSLLRDAAREVERLRSSGLVPERFERELDARFEAAAVRALRVPAFAERSARLRALARRVVPRAARPAARAAARAGDRLLRGVYTRLESTVRRG
ncbi:MAG TPA: hypothetical protein VMV02_01090 [Acidimicrobiales bacterium]|nr:hypothetical protein [Acidimicrobiales bacterium]